MGCPGADANSVCAIHNPSCFSRCLRVPIAIGRFYKQCLWIPQMFLLTNPDLHHGLLSIEVLQRVNAACVVEFTATPAADSNILHNVSATELKAEEMIKLPIRLSEHKSWEDAVGDSIRTRQRLHDIAVKDTAYVRPIVLFQAEEKVKEVTKEILLADLVEQ